MVGQGTEHASDHDGDEDTAIPEDEEPSPRQFIYRGPWKDTPRGPPKLTRFQPGSAAAAMYQYEQRAQNFETASRAATWGTGRRTSMSEIGSIMEDHKTRHLSLSKRTREGETQSLNFRAGCGPEAARNESGKLCHIAPELPGVKSLIGLSASLIH